MSNTRHDSSEQTSELLRLQGISFCVDSVYILKDIDMVIGHGEVYALIGTNGTGKSTLAYLIMGCANYRPATGRIIFEGRDITDIPLHERAKLGITLAWQEPARFEGITVKEYLCIASKDSDPAQYLSMVGLHPGSYLERMVDRSLSGGERKRIELACVIAMNPKLAILDEPDSGIDMLSIGDVVNVLEEFKQRGSSVLLITHREEIARCADRASLLCHGRIFATGSPEEVADIYKSRSCSICYSAVCE